MRDINWYRNQPWDCYLLWATQYISEKNDGRLLPPGSGFSMRKWILDVSQKADLVTRGEEGWTRPMLTDHYSMTVWLSCIVLFIQAALGGVPVQVLCWSGLPLPPLRLRDHSQAGRAGRLTRVNILIVMVANFLSVIYIVGFNINHVTWCKSVYLRENMWNVEK